MVGSVQDEVLTHDGQTYETKVSTRFRCAETVGVVADRVRRKISQRSPIECAIMTWKEGSHRALDDILPAWVFTVCEASAASLLAILAKGVDEL